MSKPRISRAAMDVLEQALKDEIKSHESSVAYDERRDVLLWFRRRLLDTLEVEADDDGDK